MVLILKRFIWRTLHRLRHNLISRQKWMKTTKKGKNRRTGQQPETQNSQKQRSHAVSSVALLHSTMNVSLNHGGRFLAPEPRLTLWSVLNLLQSLSSGQIKEAARRSHQAPANVEGEKKGLRNNSLWRRGKSCVYKYHRGDRGRRERERRRRGNRMKHRLSLPSPTGRLWPSLLFFLYFFLGRSKRSPSHSSFLSSLYLGSPSSQAKLSPKLGFRDSESVCVCLSLLCMSALQKP